LGVATDLEEEIGERRTMVTETTADRIANLLNALEEKIDAQFHVQVLGQDDDDDDKTKIKTKILAAKDATKAALFAILQDVSDDVLKSNKLSVIEARNKIDELLMKHATILKWPFLRSLSNISHYCPSFLALPKTMEQTRRFLTTISAAKVEEILLLAAVVPNDFSDISNPQELVWAQEVLYFMTGDGRRKKELGGFVLQNKGPLRAVLNKAKSRHSELQIQQQLRCNNEPTTAPQDTNYSPEPIGIAYKLERDVRIIDREREQIRAKNLGILVDSALQKKG